jgi:hypothetical protein
MRREDEIALRLRQQALLLQIAQQRTALAQQLQVLAGPLATADALHRGWRRGRAWLQDHQPQVALAAGGAVALLVLLRPRRALRWAWRAASVLRAGWPWLRPAWRAWRRSRAQAGAGGDAAPARSAR